MLSNEAIITLLNNTNNDNFDTNIGNLLENTDSPTYKILIYRLFKYKEHMSADSALLDKNKLESLQFDLFSLINEVVFYKDWVKYKICMDIINLFFSKYSNDAFSYNYLTRFKINNYTDELGVNTNDSYMHLFTSLNNRKINPSSYIQAMFPIVLDRYYVRIKDYCIDNLKKYYKERYDGN